MPKKRKWRIYVPPMIKLCLGLHLLAGVSYLDLSFGYDVPHNTVHFYSWQALHAVDASNLSLLDSIKPSSHATVEELATLESGFERLSNFIL
jgi:hypothetical protein